MEVTRLHRVALMLGVASLVLGGCASSASTPTKTGVLNIGEIYSSSGALAPFAIPAHDGLRFAVSQINAKGFLVGGTKYTLNLITVDNRSDQTASVAAVNQLIRDNNVPVLFGPIGQPAVAVAQVTSAAHVVNFTAAGAAAAIAGGSQYRELFAVAPNNEIRVQAMLASIKKYAPQVKKVVIVSSTVQQNLVPPELAGLQAAGYTTSVSLYEVGQPDYSAMLTKIANDKPDLILLSGSTGIESLLRQLDAAGIGKDVTMFGWGYSVGAACPNFGGRPCIADPIAYDLTANQPQVKKFVVDYLKFTGQPDPGQQAAYIPYYYDPAFMVVEAMEKAGTVTDGVKIAEAYRNLTHTGLLGTITINPKDNSPVNALPITFVKGGITVTGMFP